MKLIAARSQPARSDAQSRAGVRGALAALSLSLGLAALGTSMANVAVPTLAEVFTASFQQAQWVVIGYLVTVTSLIVGAGRLGDLMGRRRLLLAGIVVFTAASAGGGAAPTLELLIVARGLQGAGAAMMMALALAFVGETVPKQKMGSAMGLLGTMSAVGTALGPSLGGMLLAGPGWRAMFFVNVPLGLAAFLLARRFLPPDVARLKDDRAAFDGWGTLVLALTLAAYALAMTLGRGRFGPLNLSLMLAAALGVGLFLRVEASVASPLVRLATLRDPGLRAGLGSSALVSTVLMGTLLVGPFYLSRALALEAAQVGLVLSAGPLMAALTGVPAGRLVDRFGASRVTCVGLSGIAAGCVLLSLLPLAAGVSGYVGAMVVLTAGYGLFQTANNAAVMSERRPDERGVVSGLLNLSRNLGLITGASAMGAIFAFAAGANNAASVPPAAVAFGFRVTFAVATVLVVVALAMAVGAAVGGRQSSEGGLAEPRRAVALRR